MTNKRKNEGDELQCIKNLLILQLIKDGATSEEISMALRAGHVSPGRIRHAFSMRKIKKKAKDGK